MAYHRPDTDKPHRCPGCWAVLTHQGANTTEDSRIAWMWQVRRCYSCGDRTVFPALHIVPFRVKRWVKRRVLRMERWY